MAAMAARQGRASRCLVGRQRALEREQAKERRAASMGPGENGDRPGWGGPRLGHSS